MRPTKSIGAITWLVEQGKAMFTRRFMGTVTALAAAAALVVVAPASAEGVTPAQLQAQGWTCFVPPNLPDTIVCGNPAHGLPPVPPDPNRRPSYSFLLFSLDGSVPRDRAHDPSRSLPRPAVPPDRRPVSLQPPERLLPVRGLDAAIRR